MPPRTDREEDLLAMIVDMEEDHKREMERTRFSYGITVVILCFLGVVYGTVVGVNLCPK